MMDDPTPARRLFSPGLIGAVGFVGGALGGATLAFINSRQLKDGRGAQALSLGFLITVLRIALVEAFPASGLALALIAGLVLWLWAKVNQGAAFRQYLATGARPGDIWQGAPICLASMLVTFCLNWAAIRFLLNPPSKVMGDDQVFYLQGAVASDAQLLLDGAAKLKDHDDGICLWLRKSDGILHVGWVVLPHYTQSRQEDEYLRFLGQTIATEIVRAPICMDEVDERGRVLKTLPLIRP